MNSELDKLVQQYADLYPYKQPPATPDNLLSAPTKAPPAQSIQIPLEQVPPNLNPTPKELRLIPRTTPPVVIQSQSSGSRFGELFCGDNLVRLVLVAILFIFLVMYFRKK